MKNVNLTHACTAASFLATTFIAAAVPQLRVSDGSNTALIFDNGPNDLNPAPGIILYSGGVGASWTGTVGIGRTKPDLGTAGDAYLDLSVNAVSKGTGVPTLTIQYTDTDFLNPGDHPVGVAAIGGIADGTVVFNTYADNANQPFGGTLLSSYTFTGSDGNHGFNADSSALSYYSTGPYSLTLEWVITHGDGTQLTTGDSSLRKVAVADSGETLVLAALAFAGLAGWRGRRLAPA